MSLPPGFLDELRGRISLAQVVGRKVTWDMRKSNQGKGDMWAPCPFHQEKTASFHVDDRKGFYYCFGCHAKGDALTFLRETENLGFMEAVEVLSREVGMTMPAQDPHAREKAGRREQLLAVMEQAARFFIMQLKTAAATDARDYLASRGLSTAAMDRFGIGFAPDSRQGLWTHLADSGVEPELMLATGLAARPEDGGAPYDRFRGRIIFPIRDAQGRCIAFGGRAMQEGARAKYLNSPETELFDKGRTLYNLQSARVAAGKGQPLVVAEGYMDVIALSEAGFAASVAPLGTAITENQLRMLWRVSSEPVIALDGDTAGLRAGLRLMDLALPLIEAGQSLRFAMLPEKQDPDDLIRAGGPQAMQRLIDSARPMVSLLWQRETEGRTFDSPERRAALDKRLRETIKVIRDPSLRRHYGEELNTLRRELFAPARGRGTRTGTFRRQGGASWPRPPLASLPSTRQTLLGSGQNAAADEYLREAIILAILVRHPSLIAHFESELERIDMIDPGHARLRVALLQHAETKDAAKLADLIRETVDDTLEKLMSLNHVAIAPPVQPDADPEFAKMCLAQELAKLSTLRGSRREISEAMEDLDGLADEGITWRLGQAAAARHRSERTPLGDAADLGEDRASLSGRLQELIDAQVWKKNKGKEST